MKKALLAVVIILTANSVIGQIKYNGAFGKGIRLETEDKSFKLKIGVRVQPRWDFVYQNESNTFEQAAFVARGRMKFDGYMVNPNLRYKIEFDVVGGYVRDATVKYRFAKHSDLWFGQAKLPGNRERVVSSGNLQFVNRSLFNDRFNIDRDVGIQFHHYFEIGNFIIRDMYAISGGNGIRNKKRKEGLDFTTRFEFLPMGFFTGKGDYISGDLKREQKLKMAIGIGADYNMGAHKTNGQIGLMTDETRDILTVLGDILFKYKGWSLMGEAGMRSTPNKTPLVYDEDGLLGRSFYTGFGYNIQTGYLFKNNYELSARYSAADADNIAYQDEEVYTLGASKYIVGHKLKIQADFSYRDLRIAPDEYIGRLQMEIHF